MAITTQQLSGTMNGPDGALANGRLVLKLVGSDTEPGEMIIGNRTYEVELDGSGAIPGTFTPWANGAGENGGTHYEATVYDADERPREIGTLSIPETGEPHDIGALWNQNIPETPSLITPVPTSGMAGVISGDIVLGEDDATFDVDMGGTGFVSSAQDGTANKVVKTYGVNGWMGLGADSLPTLPNDNLQDTTDLSQIFSFDGSTLNPHPEITAGSGVSFARGGVTESRLLIGNSGDIGVLALVSGVWKTITAQTSRNTTDVNGLYVTGRNWISVSDTASAKLGDEDVTPSFSKVSTGVYEITGTNAVAIGPRVISLPVDDNTGLAVVHAGQSESGGTITLQTFDPADGTTPMDIPSGRYVGIKIALS